MINPNKAISKVEIIRKIKDAGYANTLIESFTSASSKFVLGDLRFDTLASGIKVHCVDVIEKANGKATSEIEPCISINILLRGTVKFAFDEQHYSISATEQPVIFASTINKKQIFTRYFQRDEHIEKLNITVKKSWLMARCKSKQDVLDTEKIFLPSSSVYSWSCNDELQQLAQSLMKSWSCLTVSSNIQSEQSAFQIFYQCFQLLLAKEQLQKSLLQSRQVNIDVGKFRYEEKLDKLIEENCSLAEISHRLGASISTLQRYFKNRHQMTLKKYIRKQRLERARQAIIFDHLTIGEAAYFAGYNHVSNFITAFKKYYSLTPAQVQKQHHQ